MDFSGGLLSDSREERHFRSSPRRVETASGTNAASNSPQTYGGSTEEAGVSKRVTGNSTTNDDIIRIKIKDNLKLTDVTCSSGVTLICKIQICKD